MKDKYGEKEPVIKFRRKRIWKWDCILGHRFFDDSIGFFTVQKAWYCKKWCRYAVTPGFSHWFDHHTIQIRTDYGEKLILHKLPFDCNGVFHQPYDKKGKLKNENESYN